MTLQYRLFIVAALLLSPPIVAIAQEYPVKPVRIVVPFPPGAGNDTQARLLAKKINESTGQPVLVDNRAGVNGQLGAEYVAKSPADGYTLLFTSAGLAANATLRKRADFNPLTDLSSVTLFSVAPQFLIVHPSVPVTSVKELVALARKNPGKLNAGSSGSGAANHLAIEMFKQMAGVSVTHIPYKGGGPALTAVLSGEVDLNFQGAIAALPHIRSGKVRALAVTTAKKSSAAPELPTMNTFFPDYESANWFAVFAPGGTPAAVIAKINAESVKALKSTEVRELLRKEGIEPVGNTSQEMTAYLKREVDRAAQVIKAGNLQVE